MFGERGLTKLVFSEERAWHYHYKSYHQSSILAILGFCNGKKSSTSSVTIAAMHFDGAAGSQRR